jgi:hypothetical protein
MFAFGTPLQFVYPRFLIVHNYPDHHLRIHRFFTVYHRKKTLIAGTILGIQTQVWKYESSPLRLTI